MAGVWEGCGHFPFLWGPHHILKARKLGLFPLLRVIFFFFLKIRSKGASEGFSEQFLQEATVWIEKAGGVRILDSEAETWVCVAGCGAWWWGK